MTALKNLGRLLLHCSDYEYPSVLLIPVVLLRRHQSAKMQGENDEKVQQETPDLASVMSSESECRRRQGCLRLTLFVEVFIPEMQARS
jgi:hypothetical protein